MIGLMNHYPLLPALIGVLVAGILLAWAVWGAKAGPTKTNDQPTDGELSDFLDWRTEKAEVASAEATAAREAENLECGDCKKPYLAKDGHECAPPPSYRITNIIPITGEPIGRMVKEPIFDRVFIPPGSSSTIQIFTCGIGQPDPNDPQNVPKTASDTSVRVYPLQYGGHSCAYPVPRGGHFYWHNFKVVPDEGSDPDDVREIKNRGAFDFVMAQTKYRTFLGPEAMTEEGADVTIQGEPLQLYALEHFYAQLPTQGLTIKKGVWLRVMLLGVKRVPICG